MHNLQPPIELNKDFIADGCSESSGDSITFGAGQQFDGIYDFVEPLGYRIVGGSSITVGAAGGWITGAGHSMLSNELGTNGPITACSPIIVRELIRYQASASTASNN